jgi:tellurite resistance protein TehA-like permease
MRLRETIQNLFPGYFALVMATGIVSVAAHFLEMDTISIWLFYLNLIFYTVLWILFLIRLFKYPSNFLKDLIDHAKGPGFFTLIAGTCVLGTQFANLAHDTSIARMLWYLGIMLWIILMYTFFTAVTVHEPKPTLETGLNGAWLIVVVATQSIAVLGTLVTPEFKEKQVVLFFSLCMFLLGCMLYLFIIGLIFYRWTFFKMTPQQLTPPYWINMGALAITTLAGSRLILSASDEELIGELLPFLKGFTVFFWSTGTWWIPLLLILGGWRHLYEKVPLKYDPQYWGMVFPLGMYTASTFQLAHAIHQPFLMAIPQVFVYVALFAWTTTFIAMLLNIGKIYLNPAKGEGIRPTDS